MNDKATDHYNITLHEIEQGTSIQELRDILQSYQDAELYEECQGIHLAIEIGSLDIAIFECSDEFYSKGEAKLEQAISNYKYFFGEEDMDLNQYVLRGIL